MDLYQSMITGTSQRVDVPDLNFLQLIVIVKSVLKAIYLYKKENPLDILQYFPLRSTNIKETPQIVYLFARKVSVFSQVLINIFRRESLCLERSIITCAALRSVGIEAQVIIGSRASANSSTNYLYHSWIEVLNKPINDVDGVKQYFNEIHRFPMEVNNEKSESSF
ncbi:lasso peptide biosynthesis B2 protein [Thermoflavimicrobium daqui]|uniref:Lasso peptide biosynthesis B2 protein n=1 Tax=Thermoflavimicrobium daqui TaxID=2137476 RepID=A0A364K503_9BACL|nr:lasso peptide biosynthesis B2 protein [Thermoflavimicrobium daqui]RAL24464.1 lasso peptide biosynthesis B2 protein [Thermoflavimicrobium daqui]